MSNVLEGRCLSAKEVHPKMWTRVSVTRYSFGRHKDTTRCASSFLNYKCAIFCLDIMWSDRHLNSLGFFSSVPQETKCPETDDHHGSAKIPEVLDAGSPKHGILDITAPQIAVPEIRFGTRSDFGFHKPSPFFDLPAIRSELPTIRIGMGSVQSVCQYRRLGFFSLVTRSGDS